MNIKSPSNDPHGLNSNLVFTIENNTQKNPLKVDIFRADNNSKIGSKLYSPANTIEVGVTGYLTPNLDVSPIQKEQPDIITANNRAFPIKIKTSDIAADGSIIHIESNEIMVSAAKENIEFNTVMNAINKFVAPITKDDNFEIAVITDGKSIIEAELKFIHKNTIDEWTKTLTMSQTYKGIAIFNINISKFAQEMVNQNIKWEEYDDLKCTIRNRSTNSVIAKYSIPIVNRRKNSTRLCWKNRLGAIEYYTFPYMKRRLTKIDKDRVQTENGGRITKATVEKIIEIQSDFEIKEAIEQIAEIAQATNVWICEQNKYTPVVVLDSEITIEEERCTYIELKISLSQEEEFVA